MVQGATLQVALLCGGLATRMRSFSETLPKSLFPVAGRPFLEWQLATFAAHGVTDVLLCIGHRGEAIRAWVQDHDRFGLRVAFSDEGDRKLGTGGALKWAAEQGLLAPRFIVHYGDSYLRLDYRALLGTRAEAVLAVYSNEGRFDASNCVVERNKVVLYEKGTTHPQATWIDYGAAVLDRTLAATAPPDLADLYRALAAAGRLAAFPVSDRFYEIGSIQGLAETEAFLQTEFPDGPRPRGSSRRR